MIALQISDLSRLSAAASSGINGGRRSVSTRKIQLRFSAGKGRNGCQETRAAAETATEKITSDEPQISVPEEPPSIDFAFVSPTLLPDGSPDVQIRSAVGGQKLRDIMLDGHVDLYGPYARPLLNCCGGGTCGTCLVEVVEGKELLSPRTEKEKQALNKRPKNWRLACQTTVGTQESRGQIVIQQLPEWKAHEWQK